MSKRLADALGDEDDCDLIADSLDLLAAFREIRDAKVRRTVLFLTRALRPDPEEAAIVAKAVNGAGATRPPRHRS